MAVFPYAVIAYPKDSDTEVNWYSSLQQAQDEARKLLLRGDINDAYIAEELFEAVVEKTVNFVKTEKP
jgi:hypothetical protein